MCVYVCVRGVCMSVIIYHTKCTNHYKHNIHMCVNACIHCTHARLSTVHNNNEALSPELVESLS